MLNLIQGVTLNQFWEQSAERLLVAEAFQVDDPNLVGPCLRLIEKRLQRFRWQCPGYGFAQQGTARRSSPALNFDGTGLPEIALVLYDWGGQVPPRE
jgi:hypothetical protein